MHVYEYLFTAIILIAIMLGSTMMVTMISAPSRDSAARDELKITTEKIMTQILLDPGFPYNWGSENTPASDMKFFGLAKYGQTSREAYMLDPDKVLRLNSILQQEYVTPASAAGLLNMGTNPSDYGFTLEFNETLQISTPEPVQGPPDTYTVSVNTTYNMPAINAQVTAFLYYLDAAGIAKTETTGVFNDGKYTLSFNNGSQPTGNSKTMLVIADCNGAHIAKIFPISGTITAYLLGSSIIHPSEPIAIGGAAVKETILIKDNSKFTTRDFRVYMKDSTTMTQPPEPSAIAVMAVSGTKLLVAYRDYSISYRTSFAVRSTTFAYSLQRRVIIGESTYTATLYLWRMSS